MKIYTVLSWINTEKTKRPPGNGRYTNEDRRESHYTKRKTAHEEYEARVRDMNALLSCSFRGEIRTGRVKLFTPHIHENGLLAYWPKNDKYIAEYEKSDQGDTK